MTAATPVADVGVGVVVVSFVTAAAVSFLSPCAVESAAGPDAPPVALDVDDAEGGAWT